MLSCCSDVISLYLQHVPGGATGCSAEIHAGVTTGVCVTLLLDPADVDWAGLEPTVTQVQL